MAYGNVDGLEYTETAAAKFEADAVVRFWRHNAMRMLRANERVLHGLMWATKREIELGQDLMRYNLENLQGTAQRAANGAGQDALNKTDIDRNAGELKHFVTGMREVAEELQRCFSEAATLMFKGSIEEAREATAQASEAVAAPIKKTAHKAEGMVKQAVEAAADG